MADSVLPVFSTPMGWRRQENGGFISAWATSVGATQLARRADPAAGLRITYLCTDCGVSGDVDIDKLVRLKGPDYSLVDRRCRCRVTPGCTGWIRFRYMHGHLIPLWTDAGVDRWTAYDDALKKVAAAAIYDSSDARERKRRADRR